MELTVAAVGELVRVRLQNLVQEDLLAPVRVGRLVADLVGDVAAAQGSGRDDLNC